MIWLSVGIPTICYLIASGVMIRNKNYPDAMMFFGYAFANLGIISRLL